MKRNDHMIRKSMDDTLEKTMAFKLNELVVQYDEKIIHYLSKRDVTRCEEYLLALCYDLIDLSEEEQLFLLRVYFTSIVTHVVRKQMQKERLHPLTLAHASSMIMTIEGWQYTTNFITSIHWFIDHLIVQVIKDVNLINYSPHIKRILTLINDHLQEKHLSVQWIAGQMNLSTTHLSNIFKQEVDETINKYIKKRKIEEITFELKYTNQSINDISAKYGFTNKSYFIQYFKKAEGTTPLKYKQNLYK